MPTTCVTGQLDRLCYSFADFSCVAVGVTIMYVRYAKCLLPSRVTLPRSSSPMPSAIIIGIIIIPPIILLRRAAPCFGPASRCGPGRQSPFT